MYRCGNKVEIGDCVEVRVAIDVQEMNISPGEIAMVLETNYDWSGTANQPLLTIKLSDDQIQQIPAKWCKLCQRK